MASHSSSRHESWKLLAIKCPCTSYLGNAVHVVRTTNHADPVITLLTRTNGKYLRLGVKSGFIFEIKLLPSQYKYYIAQRDNT